MSNDGIKVSENHRIFPPREWLLFWRRAKSIQMLALGLLVSKCPEEARRFEIDYHLGRTTT
jgi:hypothetical protein